MSQPIKEVVAAYFSEGCKGLQSVLEHVVADRKVPRFEDDEADIMMYIQRSKNANVVCYKALFKEREGSGLAEGNIDSFWLDVDPAYIEANRKKGKEDNRCDFNIIERKMAYGVSSPEHVEVPNVPITSDIARTSHVYLVVFVALSSKPMLFTRFETKVGGGSFPVAFCLIAGKLSVVSRIFVQSTEPKHFYQLPKVEYVDIFGWSVEDGSPITERILP